MGFLEAIAGKIATYLAGRIFDMLRDQIQKAIEYERIYEKHDKLKNEMAEELAQATTEEERDAILTKIYNSRPSFD